APILCLVHLIEVSAGVRHVCPRRVAVMETHRRHDEQTRAERRGSFEHRGIHDLPATGGLRLVQPADKTEGEHQAAATHVADSVAWWERTLTRAGERVKHPGESDVVDVVAGAPGERPGLAPASHAPVYEARIPCQANVRTQPQPLHDARSEALDQR